MRRGKVWGSRGGSDRLDLPCSYEEVQTDKKGEVVGIVGRISQRGEARPKGNLHWIAACGAAKVS